MIWRKTIEAPVYPTEPGADITPERAGELLRNFLMSDVWRKVIEPELRGRLEAEVSYLVRDTAGQHRRSGAIAALLDILNMPRREAARGRALAIQWFLRWPAIRTAQIDLDKERVEEHNRNEERWKHLAEWGHGAPNPFPPMEQ